jgi:hypothetical protein
MPPPCRTSTCPSLGVGAGNPLTPLGDKSFPNPGVYREMGDRLFL